MPTYTSAPEQDVATTHLPSMIAAGAGDHLPIGDYSTADYRSAMRFARPSWAGWTNIVSATLKVYISDHQHVAPKSSSIFCSMMAVPVWTKDQGTQDCENGFSGSNNTQYDDIQSVATNRISFSSGSTANAAKTLDVTAMVRYYKANNSPLVFVFDNNGADQYTELWALGKAGTTYDAILTINYETASPPNQPALVSPVGSVVVQDTKPVFSWTHSDPQGDAQSQANVQLYDSAGTAIGAPVNVPGATNTLTWPTDLTRGLTYKWAVQTADAVSGFGAYSAQQTFAIKANPTVTIDTTRYMDFNGQPRLRVKWTTSQPQGSYQVTAGAYTSGIVPGNNQNHLLDTLAISDNVPVTVTVQVWNTDGTPLTGSASRSFTPRYGLTTHRRDLTATPFNWLGAVVDSIQPADTLLRVEYGSSATATAAPSPNVWYTDIGLVPLAQYLFWRAWFIPSATAGPTLNKITVTSDRTLGKRVDKWRRWDGTPAGAVFGAPWALDESEFVYGTRAVRIDNTGTADNLRSEPIEVKAGRSYILTGLMKSQGNSGAFFYLVDSAGATLVNMVDESGNPLTLTGTVSWFNETDRDVNRYKTAVWKSTFDGIVYVLLAGTGASGTKAWFDAIKLEESTVATPWSPAAVGATVIDAGGVQVDGSKGGILRYKGVLGETNTRAVVAGGDNGLLFAGDTELSSPSSGLLAVNGQPLGGVYVGNSPPASPGNGQLWWDDDDATKGGGQGYGLGTSFPASPAIYDRFWRSDMAMEFFWNGTRWLSSQQFRTQTGQPPGGVALAASAATLHQAASPSLGLASDVWLEYLTTQLYVIAGTALSAANKWVGTWGKRGANNADVAIATVNCDSGAVSVWKPFTTPINALQDVGNPAAVYYWLWAKTGTPGGLYYNAEVVYRLVAV